MIRTLLTYRPRPSLVWSVGFHAALGAALWGSGVLRIPLQGSDRGLVVSLAAPSIVPPPAAPELALPLEAPPLDELPMLEPELVEFQDELDAAESAEPDSSQAAERATPVARPVTRRQLPTRHRELQQLPGAQSSPDPQPPVAEPLEPSKAAPEAEPAAAAPLCVGPTELAAHCPPPPYPRRAERRGLQGTVELRIHVRPDGTVQRVEVVSTSGHQVLDDAAQTAVLDWRYAPATEDGRAVGRTVSKRIEFQIP